MRGWAEERGRKTEVARHPSPVEAESGAQLSPVEGRVPLTAAIVGAPARLKKGLDVWRDPLQEEGPDDDIVEDEGIVVKSPGAGDGGREQGMAVLVEAAGRHDPEPTDRIVGVASVVGD